MKTLSFKNGDTIPAIGLGTWKSEPGEVQQAVVEAIRVGYRHVDCAPAYGNEPEVGNAIRQMVSEKIIRRDELWVTSKLWNNAHRPEDVAPALKQTLQALQLDHLNLHLMHWPIALKPGVSFPEKAEDFLSLSEVPLIETWQAMEECVQQGLTQHIGVSNFSQKKLEELIQQANIKPEMNQVEMHPFLQQNELLAYCKEQGILVTAYSPLGSNDRPERVRKENAVSLLEDKTINAIADKHGCSPAQVLIRWAVARDTVVIPKSVNPKRIQQNLASMDVTLDQDDRQQLTQMDAHRRYIDGGFWVMEGNDYTMASLWDE